MFVGLSMMTFSMAQNATTGVVGNSEVLKSIPQLNELAEKVNAAYLVYQQSATSSRSAAAAAKADYESALTNYLNELQVQITKKTNATYTDNLQAEMDLVKKLQTNLSTTSTK